MGRRAECRGEAGAGGKRDLRDDEAPREGYPRGHGSGSVMERAVMTRDEGHQGRTRKAVVQTAELEATVRGWRKSNSGSGCWSADRGRAWGVGRRDSRWFGWDTGAGLERDGWGQRRDGLGPPLPVSAADPQLVMWPLSGIWTIFLTLSLAELASVYPVSGAMASWAWKVARGGVGWERWWAWLMGGVVLGGHVANVS